MSTTSRLRRAAVESLYGIKRRLLRAAPVLDRGGAPAPARRRGRARSRSPGPRSREPEGSDPGGPVSFASPRDESFLRVSKFYPGGTFDRPDVFVCDVPSGAVHVGHRHRPDRLRHNRGGVRPRVSASLYLRLWGPAAPPADANTMLSLPRSSMCSATTCTPGRIHSLPRIVSLEGSCREPNASRFSCRITLHEAQRELSRYAASFPRMFRSGSLSKRTWGAGRPLKVILLSLPLRGYHSGTVFFRPNIWSEIRTRVSSADSGCPSHSNTARTVFVSRQGDRHRRVRNEAAVMEALAPLGFRSVYLVGMSARRTDRDIPDRRDRWLGPTAPWLGWLLLSGLDPGRDP